MSDEISASERQAKLLEDNVKPPAKLSASDELRELWDSDGDDWDEKQTARARELLAQVAAERLTTRKRESVAGQSDRNGERGAKRSQSASQAQGDAILRFGYGSQL